MLKKPAMLFLMMLYLVTATGFTLNLHYCFGTLASVKIDAAAKSCTKSLLTAKRRCCHDKQIDIKVKDSHQTSTKSSLSKIFNEELLFILTDNLNFSISERPVSVTSYRGPPTALQKGTIYLQNCNFRI